MVALSPFNHFILSNDIISLLIRIMDSPRVSLFSPAYGPYLRCTYLELPPLSKVAIEILFEEY